MRRDGIFWGTLFVLLGGLFLAQNLGYLPPNIQIWGIFWPLLLIGFGVRALLRATNRGEARDQETFTVPLSGATRAQVKIVHAAGELRIDDRAAPGELVNGSFGGGVEHLVRKDGDEVQVELKLPGANFPAASFPFDSPDRMNWTVGLNPETPLRLELEVGASRSLLDLSKMQLKELRISTGASSTEIQFPERAGFTQAWVHCGAAGISVVIPQNVAARIRIGGALYGVEVDEARFPRSGNHYTSPDYETAENRVNLEVETGVGSVKVK